MTLRRTQYWNVATHTVRTGATGHGESLVDLEDYLLPFDRARGSALHSFGVADGLAVSATAGAPGVTVATGLALDVAGRTIVLSGGSAAVVDQTVDATAVQDVPTVVVGPAGVTMDTAGGVAGGAATCLLTLTWREVLGENTLANVPALLHAPWLRLVPLAGFVDRGDQVVLAQLTIDTAGQVQDLAPGPRRLAGSPSGRLELRIPTASAGPTPTVGQTPAATLAAEPNGDVVLNLLGGPAPVGALRISSGTGDARLSGGLSVAGSLSAGAGLSVAGALAVGLAGAPAARTVHVEGDEIHSGGPAGGLSFADRTGGSFVAVPDAGQRWVWYAQDGEARLWSGADLLKVRSGSAVAGSSDGAGLDVLRRMRVRSHGVFSAGIWFHQDRDRGFAGMADDTHIGFYGADGAGWGLTMDTASANVGMGIGLTAPQARLHVDGFTAIRASGRVSPTGGGIFPLPPFRRWGVGVEASGDIGIRSTGRLSAAQFDGNVSISGTLSKGGGGFTIDHPLDPARKYLSHSFVESPEMLNLYAGTVTTDADGLAWVELPEYFEALNRDVTYQLTALGAPGGLAVAEEVVGNRFAIRSDPGEVTVSWLVTGVRRDPWADAHRIVPEEPKPHDAVDLYLHPDLHGVAADRSIFGPATPTTGDSTE